MSVRLISDSLGQSDKAGLGLVRVLLERQATPRNTASPWLMESNYNDNKTMRWQWFEKAADWIERIWLASQGKGGPLTLGEEGEHQQRLDWKTGEEEEGATGIHCQQ